MPKPVIIYVLLSFVLMLDGVESVKRCRYYAGNLSPGSHDMIMIPGIAWNTECCQKCRNTPGCLGFVHNSGNQCWLKDTQGPITAAGQDDVAGIIEVLPQDEIDRLSSLIPRKTCRGILNTKQNLDPGHDLSSHSSVFSFDECCQLCKNNIDCKGFVRNSANTCWLKFNGGSFVHDDANGEIGIIEYSVKPTTTNTPKPYICSPRFNTNRITTTTGYDIRGYDLISYPVTDFYTCANQCARCEECQGYVFDPKANTCQLKSSGDLEFSDDSELIAGAVY